jgi:hypothetical protein
MGPWCGTVRPAEGRPAIATGRAGVPLSRDRQRLARRILESRRQGSSAPRAARLLPTTLVQ